MPTPSDVDIWPLLGVRIQVSDIELCPIDDRTALDLGRLAAGGIHGNFLPFATPWTRGSEVDVARNVYRYHSRQGKGIGTLTRIAVLALAFDGLGAHEVTTSAWADNVASNAVTRKLGYEANGEERLDREGRVTVQKRFRMTREMWDARVPELRPHTEMGGVDKLREWLQIS